MVGSELAERNQRWSLERRSPQALEIRRGKPSSPCSAGTSGPRRRYCATTSTRLFAVDGLGL